MVDVTVVVPTRHERGNVAALAARLAGSLDPTGIDWRLLFVDDSDDDTPDVIASLPSPRVGVLHRPPAERTGGLSGAVMAGVAATTSRWVAVMDGDLQHPPEAVGQLLEPLRSGTADLVVASRYVAGGSPGGLAGPWRLFVSGAARRAAHLVFPRSRRVSDPLGGFFAFDRAVVEGVSLRPHGFKILLEVIVRGRWSQVAVVPYRFAARVDGRSKAGLREGMRFVRHVCQLWVDAGQTGLSGTPLLTPSSVLTPSSPVLPPTAA
jgi:dolichol-phosphate mannosyltransferase